MRPFDNRHSPDKPTLTKQGHLQDFSSRGVQSSPVSLSGSLTDVPLLLVNGAPQPDLHIHSPAPDAELVQTNSKPFPSHSELQCVFSWKLWHLKCMTDWRIYDCEGFKGCFSGSQPSMKFVMDTSKFWFRPHISRAEGESLYAPLQKYKSITQALVLLHLFRDILQQLW